MIDDWFIYIQNTKKLNMVHTEQSRGPPARQQQLWSFFVALSFSWPPFLLPSDNTVWLKTHPVTTLNKFKGNLFPSAASFSDISIVAMVTRPTTQTTPARNFCPWSRWICLKDAEDVFKAALHTEILHQSSRVLINVLISRTLIETEVYTFIQIFLYIVLSIRQWSVQQKCVAL